MSRVRVLFLVLLGAGLRPRLRFVSCVALALSCTDDNEDSQACTDTSVCGAAATIKFDLPPTMTFADLEQSTVTVCRNDLCLTGDFASLNAPPSANTGVGIGIATTADGGKTNGASALVMATPSGQFWLQVFWPLGVGAAPADGDTYKASVTNGAGTEVQSYTDVATYVVTYPYGKDCPTTCAHVEFDHHTS
jgi:hypothetical protein